MASPDPSEPNAFDTEANLASHSWLIGWFSARAWNRTIIMVRNSGLMNADRKVAASRTAISTVTTPPLCCTAPGSITVTYPAGASGNSQSTKVSTFSCTTIHAEVTRIGLAFCA